MNDPNVQVAAKRDRSPAYPTIPLKTAVERLASLDEYFKRHPAPVSKVGLAWGIKPGSSQASSAIAALKAYGLVDYEGAGSDLKAVVSADGRTYLRAQQESVKRDVLRRAALQPKAIAKYWQIWGADRPPDPVCLDELIIKAKFSDVGARSFLKVYDATMAFAGLSTSDKIDDKGKEVPNDLITQEVAIGDYIQWESGGAWVFDQPKRVRAIQPHEGEDWVFVDGSTTGIPMSEVTVEQKGASAKTAPFLAEEPRLASEREWLRGPLSKDAAYRIIVTGNMGAKEIGNLIKLLEAQKLVLADSDDTQASN
jgi:hypothetical protein